MGRVIAGQVEDLGVFRFSSGETGVNEAFDYNFGVNQICRWGIDGLCHCYPLDLLQVYVNWMRKSCILIDCLDWVLDERDVGFVVCLDRVRNTVFRRG